METKTTKTAKVAKTVKTPKAAKTTKVATKKAKSTMEQISATADVINTEIVGTTQAMVADVKADANDFKASLMNGVKEVTDTLDIEDNVNRIKETAKIVNVQVTETATEIMDDVKETGKKIKAVTAKLAKEAVDSLEINERLSTVKETAAKVNLKVKATATNLVDDAVENGKKWRKDARKSAEKANEYALVAADELVEGVLSNGEKWQKITNKAVKGGLQLAEKQQEIVFSTLEAMKTQTLNSVERLKKLFTDRKSVV